MEACRSFMNNLRSNIRLASEGLVNALHPCTTLDEQRKVLGTYTVLLLLCCLFTLSRFTIGFFTGMEHTWLILVGCRCLQFWYILVASIVARRHQLAWNKYVHFFLVTFPYVSMIIAGFLAATLSDRVLSPVLNCFVLAIICHILYRNIFLSGLSLVLGLSLLSIIFAARQELFDGISVDDAISGAFVTIMLGLIGGCFLRSKSMTENEKVHDFQGVTSSVISASGSRTHHVPSVNPACNIKGHHAPFSSSRSQGQTPSRLHQHAVSQQGQCDVIGRVQAEHAQDAARPLEVPLEERRAQASHAHDVPGHPAVPSEQGSAQECTGAQVASCEIGLDIPLVPSEQGCGTKCAGAPAASSEIGLGSSEAQAASDSGPSGICLGMVEEQGAADPGIASVEVTGQAVSQQGQGTSMDGPKEQALDFHGTVLLEKSWASRSLEQNFDGHPPETLAASSGLDCSGQPEAQSSAAASEKSNRVGTIAGDQHSPDHLGGQRGGYLAVVPSEECRSQVAMVVRNMAGEVVWEMLESKLAWFTNLPLGRLVAEKAGKSDKQFILLLDGQELAKDMNVDLVYKLAPQDSIKELIILFKSEFFQVPANSEQFPFIDSERIRRGELEENYEEDDSLDFQK